MTSISATTSHSVTCTVDIPGRLPNAVFTLLPSTILTILTHSLAKQDIFFACRKFYTVHREYMAHSLVYTSHGTSVSLYNGRLDIVGCNIQGRGAAGDCDCPVLDRPIWVRLPPVLDVWHGFGAWFAQTARGLYGWGDNCEGCLGIASMNDSVTRPTRVLLPAPATYVQLFDSVTFFYTADGWFAAGWNAEGQLGFESAGENVTTPAPVPGSASVTHFTSSCGSTFAWTSQASGGRLLACGENDNGQLGTGYDETDDVYVLRPVPLPQGVSVTRIITNWQSTFFIAGDRCFVAGWNLYGQLGLGTSVDHVVHPVELPVPVDDVISGFGVSVFRRGNTLTVCGNNAGIQLPDTGSKILSPIPLPTPGPNDFRKLFIAGHALFCITNDGTVWARGSNARGIGLPSDVPAVTQWSRVGGLPPGVEYVEYWDGSTFFIGGEALYATGLNDVGQLGVESTDALVRVPVRVVRRPPVHVFRVATMKYDGV